LLANLVLILPVPYYEPPYTGPGNSTNEPCILPGKELAIGHGPSGWPAWQYKLDESENMDLGLIKVFLSTAPVRLSHLKQLSPFGEARTCHQVVDDVVFVWNAKTIPLVQRRQQLHN
jgi:hypothetical protein